MENAADLVEISELHFSYNDLPILRGLSLKIPRGKVVAILGGSGSGKSTLLKLIGGQLAPARGWVRVDGKVVHKLGSDELYRMRRRMGMMFQSSGLFTDLSVYENIAFPIREHHDLPEELVRAMVLMKLDAVGLRGARGMMAAAPRVAGARPAAPPRPRDRDRSAAGDVRRAVRGPGSDLAQRDRRPGAQAERRARPDLDHRDLRRLRVAQAGGLHLRHRRGQADGP